VTTHINPAGHFFIESAELGLIGIAAYHDVAWRNRSCTVDVYLAAGHRTEGQIAEAYTATLAYAFDELNLHRASVHVHATDAAGARALERLGAAREVTLRGHALRDGAAHDVYEYGLLRGEHEARRSSPPVGVAGAAYGA
jgi:RimJ/RimL family protein N-acetyltransferase